jgi:predicted O-methyltransferase YrrM
MSKCDDQTEILQRVLGAAEANAQELYLNVLARMRAAITRTLAPTQFAADVSALIERADVPPDREFFGFNAEYIRTCIVLSLIRLLGIDVFVETGTWKGFTCLLMAGQTRLPVYSCERDAAQSASAARLLEVFGDRVRLSTADSRPFLSYTFCTTSFRYPLIYLDAHRCNSDGDADGPLRDELDIILASCAQFVAVIDDFRVPSTEFGFMPWITWEVIEPVLQRSGRDLNVFVPGYPPRLESGLRRGWAMVTTAAAGCLIERAFPVRQLTIINR